MSQIQIDEEAVSARIAEHVTLDVARGTYNIKAGTPLRLVASAIIAEINERRP